MVDTDWDSVPMDLVTIDGLIAVAPGNIFVP